MFTEFKEIDAVISYDYEYVFLIGTTPIETNFSQKIINISKVEFRGDFSIVTVYFPDKGGPRKLTTGVNTIRLYSKLNS